MKESKAVIVNGEDGGAILWHIGSYLEREIEGLGIQLEELGLTDAPAGISIWEGTYEYSLLDEQPMPKGKFRGLTEAEWSLIKQGKPPWNKEDWDTEESADNG